MDGYMIHVGRIPWRSGLVFHVVFSLKQVPKRKQRYFHNKNLKHAVLLLVCFLMVCFITDNRSTPQRVFPPCDLEPWSYLDWKKKRNRSLGVRLEVTINGLYITPYKPFISMVNNTFGFVFFGDFLTFFYNGQSPWKSTIWENIFSLFPSILNILSKSR